MVRPSGLSGKAVANQFESARVEQYDALRERIGRLSVFNAILAAINQIIAKADDDAGLLQRFCDLVVGIPGVALAWIGRPDEAGHFTFLAKAGPAIRYLDGIDIRSDPTVPQGRGPAGRVWRDERPIFSGNIKADDTHQPWADQLAAFDIHATAGLPLLRGGKIWAVFSLYLTSAAEFDAEMQEVSEQIASDISIGLDRLDATRREREQSRINAALLSNMTVGLCVIRYPERVLEHVNARLLEMFGASSFEDMASRSVLDFYPDAEAFARFDEQARTVLASGQISLQDVCYRGIDKRPVLVDLSGVRLDGGDETTRIIWTMVDVSERHRQAEQLRRATAARAALLSNTVAAIDMVRYPERVIVEVNQAFLDLIGFESADSVIGSSTTVLYAKVKEDQRMAKLARRILKEGEGRITDLEVVRHDGRMIYLDLHGRRLEGDSPDHPLIVWTSIDVTERYALTQDLRRLAMYDALTELPNRRATEIHITHAIDRARRSGGAVAVGMIDIDDFKPINDCFGHEAGDVLLRQIAQRMQSAMRSVDFVGRFGGDEFVVVLEGLQTEGVELQLEPILARFHEVVETPFTLGDVTEPYVAMSLGLALFPIDSDFPDALLRIADAALYKVKENKSGRRRWWRLSAEDNSDVAEAPFDAFSEESQANLAALGAQIGDIAGDFVAAFHDSLGRSDEAASVLGALGTDEMNRLVRKHEDYFRFLLAPSTLAHHITERARDIGCIHALSGISAALLGNFQATYRELLRRHLEPLSMHPRSRYRTLRAADERLQIEMHVELGAMQNVADEYNAILTHPVTGHDIAERLAHELHVLGELPGILAAVIMRPQADGVMYPEAAAGPRGDAVLGVVRNPTMVPTLDAQSPTGRGLSRAAWISGNIERVDACDTDPRSSSWSVHLTPMGVRSVVAIPILGLRSQFVLMLLGAYRSQFGSSWMQAFLLSLRGRWVDMLSRIYLESELARADELSLYREMLYARQLRMFVQPIVDTRDGAVVKVEALARLGGADVVVLPARFLSALRPVDLDVLFRTGLEQSLAWLRARPARGRALGVSLNMPPSTLVHPDCATWIDQELRRAGVDAEALTLELLESQEFDRVSHDHAIRALGRLGVRLAIDDLGSGYSSLSRLANLPFDVIKVDQSITSEVLRAPVKVLSLIRTVVQIGEDLEREVVVEGVETRDVVQAVTILGAHYVQGYAIARPMPPEEFDAWEQATGASWAIGDGIESWLSALAYCWLYMHSENSHYPTPIDRCPLTGFLLRHGEASGEAICWHTLLHEADAEIARREIQARLIAWLEAKLLEQAGEMSN